MAPITVSNVKKAHGDLEVVRGISLTVRDGSFVVLLGPSGCGKSTLLGMIAGPEPITSADVRIGADIVILRDGNIEQVGAPPEVYHHPANLFVAEFIGSPNMNLLRGEVAAGNSVPVVRANGIDLPLPEGIIVKLGQKVADGIHPEHLKPSINGTGVIAKVATVEPTGAQTHIYADLAGGEVCAITHDRLAFTPGADLRLLPDLDRLQLCDQESGKAIHG